MKMLILCRRLIELVRQEKWNSVRLIPALTALFVCSAINNCLYLFLAIPNRFFKLFRHS